MAQTREAIAAMLELFPMMVNLLQQPHVHDILRMQGHVVNWDAVNAIERECGLPETPCPNSDVTVRLGLKEPKSLK